MGSQPPSGIYLLHRVVPSMGYRWISAPPWTSVVFRVTGCLTMVFTTSCRGISAPMPGAPPSPRSSLTLVSAKFSLLSPAAKMTLHRFYFLLKCVITEVLPPSLMGSALASSQSILEMAGIGFFRHRGSFWQLPTRATPVVPAATKTLPFKPTTISYMAYTN